MPIYDGMCPDHGRFTRMHRISERELDESGYTVVRCPECNLPYSAIPAAPAIHSDEKGGMNIGARPGSREYELSQTRSGMQQLKAELEAERPGKTIRFEPPSKRRMVEYEERQHEVYRRRKERGVDMQTFEEQKAAKKKAFADAQALATEKGANREARREIVKEQVARRVENG